MQLMAHDWLKGLRDYVKVTAIAPVPADAEHRMVYRNQCRPTSSPPDEKKGRDC